MGWLESVGANWGPLGNHCPHQEIALPVSLRHEAGAMLGNSATKSHWQHIKGAYTYVVADSEPLPGTFLISLPRTVSDRVSTVTFLSTSVVLLCPF